MSNEEDSSSQAWRVTRHSPTPGLGAQDPEAVLSPTCHAWTLVLPAAAPGYSW